MAALALVPPAAVVEASPTDGRALPAIDSWAVDYGPNACTLSRSFGDPVKPVILGLVPWPRAGKIQFILVSPARPSKGDFTAGEVIAKGFAPLKGFFHKGQLKSGNAKFSGTLDEVAFLERFSAASVLTLKGGSDTFSLEVGSAAQAIVALRACTSDLLAKWGEDAAAQAMIVSPALGQATEFFQHDDYPKTALRAGEQGIAGVRFWIESTGRTSGCFVVKSSGSASIDAQTCSVITNRAQFTPAKGKDGIALKSLMYSEIGWFIPED